MKNPKSESKFQLSPKSHFTVMEEISFSAWHQIRLPDGTLEPLHRHEWLVRIYIRSKELDQLGLVADFLEIRKILKEIILKWEGKILNREAPFSEGLNPTAELVAFAIYREFTSRYRTEKGKEFHIWKVEVREAPSSWAIFQLD